MAAAPFVPRWVLAKLSATDVDLVRTLHHQCWPSERTEDDLSDPNAFLERILFCHNADKCVWLFLQDTAGATTTKPNQVIGMATAVPRHDGSFYVFNFCVAPKSRGLHLGEFMLRHLQAYAQRTPGLSGLLTGTVASDHTRLRRYYDRMGGEVVLGDFVCSDGKLPPSIKIQRRPSPPRSRPAPAAAAGEQERAGHGPADAAVAVAMPSSLEACEARVALAVARSKGRRTLRKRLAGAVVVVGLALLIAARVCGRKGGAKV